MKTIISAVLLLFFLVPLYAAENKSQELLEAVEKGKLQEAKNLVKAGADLNVREKTQGLTPLMVAVQSGDLAMVKFLISAGADVNAKDEMNGATALMWSSTPEAGEEEGSRAKEVSEEDRVAIVATLIAAKADVNQKNAWGGSALQWAVDGGEEEIVDLLLAAKADVNIRDAEERTCLMAAANYEGDQYLRIMQKLIKVGAEVNASDNHGFTPLMYAVNNFKTANTEALLKAGANVNAADKQGVTVLMKAAQKDRIEIAKVLIQSGAKLDSKTQEGKSLMDVANAAGYKDMIHFLQQVTAK